MTADARKPLREQLGQTVGLLLFGLLVLRQVSLFPGFASLADAVRWALVSGFFLLACAAYASRHAARVLARRPLDVVLPLICAALPLVQTQVPSELARALSQTLEDLGLASAAPWQLRWQGGVGVGLALAAAGEAVTLLGLFSLRRSFSIFTEARELVTGGLYRWVRHPLYLGEIAAVWGIAISWPTLWSLGVALVFSGLQSWRARREEHLLAEVFPGYASYREKAGFLWPRYPMARAAASKADDSSS